MGSVSNIIFGTMTSGYEGYGSRVHDLETARSMFDAFAAAGYRDVDTGVILGASSPAHLTQNLAAVTEGPLPGRRDQRHRRRRRNCPPKLTAGLAHHLTQTLSRATAAPQNRVIGFTTYVAVAR